MVPLVCKNHLNVNHVQQVIGAKMARIKVCVEPATFALLAPIVIHPTILSLMMAVLY